MKVAFIVSGFPDELKYLENNREKVAEKLKEHGWHVKAFIFESQTTLNAYIEELKDKQIEDFILFYTGHGDTSNQDSVLTLKLNNGTLIDINSLYDYYLSKINRKKLSIVLDACYSGNLNEQKIRDDMEYLSSSDFDEQSFECSTLEQSYFSYYFCEAIDKLEGEITLDDIKDYINDKVENQTPKHYSFDSKMIIADKILQKAKDDIHAPYKHIIDYINQKNITIKTLLESVKKYVDLKMYGALSKYEDIQKFVIHLSSIDAFYCVIRDIFKNDNDNVNEWLEQNSKPCQEIQSFGEPQVVIIFNSKNDGMKYDITFASVNLPNSSNENYSYDLADESSKNEFIEKMMSYIQHNPIVDLVLPVEFMNEDINLWEIEFNKTLSTLSRLNIRYIDRYFSEGAIKKLIIQDWEEIQRKITTNSSLFSIDSQDAIRDVGNNMPECGVCADVLLEEKHLKYLLQTQMGYIMLWLTKECSEDLSELSSNLNELQQKYHALNNRPINLMYDDPTTYYYPSKGETK